MADHDLEDGELLDSDNEDPIQSGAQVNITFQSSILGLNGDISLIILTHVTLTFKKKIFFLFVHHQLLEKDCFILFLNKHYSVFDFDFFKFCK